MDEKKSWTCKCPLCSVTHEVTMFYTGDLAVPYKYCTVCKGIVGKVDLAFDMGGGSRRTRAAAHNE